MKRYTSIWMPLFCGWTCLLIAAPSLAQVAPQPRPGVVSEHAEDEAVRSIRTAQAARAAAARAEAAPVAAARAQAAAAQNASAAATPAALQASAAASGAANAGAATVVLTPDNTRSADFGLWLTPIGSTLTVADLATSGPIAGLGLQPGDAIVSINGQPVSSEQQFLQHLLADNLRNQQIDVVIARGGVNQTVQLLPSNLIQGMVAADPLFQAGLVLDPASSNQLVVQRVFPRTAAFRAGLRPGDVVATVGGQRIATVAELNRALTASNTGVPLQVTRAGQLRGLMFTPAAGLFSQQTSGGVQAPGNLITGGVNVPRTAAGNANAAAAAAAQPAAAATQAGVAAPAAIAPPNRAGTTARGGSLFPNSALPTPATAAPGSTQRVPVIIPGATNPPAGNPVVPGNAPAGNPIAPGAAAPAAGGAPSGP